MEDERLAIASSDARTLSICCMLMADDYGNGRVGPVAAARCFPAAPHLFRPALDELAGLRFVELYEVNGQDYYHIRRWDHQRVDKPGKPHCPSPPVVPAKVPGSPANIREDSRGSRETAETPIADAVPGSPAKVPGSLAPDLYLLPVPVPVPVPPTGARVWGFKALVDVISDRREAAGGGPYKHTTGDYSKIEEAVELFRELDPECPADAAAYAFDEWAKTKWATDATWPVSAWLKDPGKHFRRAKESA